MPGKFRMRPKKDGANFFRPPSSLKKQAAREAKWSPEYREARRIRDSSRWKDLRDMCVRADPMCEMCGVSPTEDVHHIEPLVEFPGKAYDRSNLMAMCKRCHETVHVREKLEGAEKVREELKKIKRR